MQIRIIFKSRGYLPFGLENYLELCVVAVINTKKNRWKFSSKIFGPYYFWNKGPKIFEPKVGAC
jgi:hypothetical protein